MCQRLAGVVVERVGRHIEFLVAQSHVIVKHRHTGLRVVLSPVGGEHTAVINEFSSFKEITYVIKTVEVKAIGI